MQNTNTGLARAESKAMEFTPYGSNDKIKLTTAIIQNLVAVRTKTGATCSEKDALRFMMLCHAKRLNPFDGDAFLIGFDSKNGPAFNLVTAHQAYLKRAELHPEFDGFRSGIIVEREGVAVDVEGEIMTSAETLLGGWASIHFKTRKYPVTKRIPLARFAKQIGQQAQWGGPWKDDPGGMITKCAEADALRSSFPTMLGGLYLRDEIELEITRGTGSEAPTLVHVVEPRAIEQPYESNEQSESDAGFAPARTETKTEPQTAGPQSPQEQLSDLVTGWGFTFDDFLKWAVDSGNIENPDALGGFDDLKLTDAKRWLRAPNGIRRGLEMLKEGK